MAWGSLHATQPLPDGVWVDAYRGYSQCVAIGVVWRSIFQATPPVHTTSGPARLWECLLPYQLNYFPLVAPINIATSSTWDPAGERHQPPVLSVFQIFAVQISTL